MVWIIQVESTLRSLLTLAEVISTTISILDETQTNLNSSAQVVMNNCIALDFSLASQGGVCAIANTSCST